MSFLAPWAWGFLALVPVIVALYLLRIRRRTSSVSTLLFWQKILEENRRRALFQRLRHLLSLLLFLLILLLILAALARPVTGRFAREGTSTVLVLDRRVGMQAETRGQSAFERARALALGLARRSDDLRPTALLLAGGSPEIVSPFSGDPAALTALIAPLQPSDAGGELDLTLARQIAAARGEQSRVVVLTADAGLKPEGRVEVVQVGGSADNVAILAFAARPLPSSPETYSGLLRVRNFSRARRRGDVEIALDDRTIDVRSYDLAPDETFSAVFPLLPEIAPGGRGWLTARLSAPDALAADNVAYAALPVRERPRVLLVTAGDWFLENLLRADTSLRFELLGPELFRPEMASAFDAVILDDVALPGFDPATAGGNWLLTGRAASAESSATQPLVRETEPKSPLLRQVDLSQVTFLRASAPQLPTGEDWRLARPVMGLDAPLIATAEQRSTGRRLAYFGFATGDSDLPLRVAYPLLVSNTLQWLTGERTEDPRACRAGETMTLADGETVATQPGAGESAQTGGPFVPWRNGLYRTRRADQSGWIAVNTFAPASSDLRALPEPSERAAAPTWSAVIRWPLWYPLALAAFLLLLAEWLLYQRRYTE